MVVLSFKVEGFHGLSFDLSIVAQKLNNVAKAFKSRFGDYNIKYISSMRYFRVVTKRVNKKEDEYENQKTILFRVSKGIQIYQHMVIIEVS